jgi:hypothetical protein
MDLENYRFYNSPNTVKNHGFGELSDIKFKNSFSRCAVFHCNAQRHVEVFTEKEDQQMQKICIRFVQIFLIICIRFVQKNLYICIRFKPKFT